MNKNSKTHKLLNLSILDALSFIVVFLLIVGFLVFMHERLLIIAIQALFFIIMIVRLFLMKFKVNFYLLWSFLFFFFSISTSIWAYVSSNAIIASISFIQVVAVGNLIILFCDNELKLNFVKKVFIFSTIILIIRVLTYSPIDTLLNMRFGSIEGTEDLFNPNEIGRILLFSSLFIISMINKNKYLTINISLLVMFAFFLIFTGSRSSIIAYLLMVIWLISKFLGKKMTILISFPIIILVLFTIYFSLMKIPILYMAVGSRLESAMGLLNGGTVDSSIISRLNLLRSGINLFKDKPLFGFGMGNYIELVSTELYSHNNYIEIMVGGGIIGLLIYYSLYLELLFRMRKQRKRKNNALIYYLILILLYFDFTSVSYYSEISGLVLAIVYAYAIMPAEPNYIQNSIDLCQNNMLYLNKDGGIK